jgi:hypothetical protein
MFILRIADKVKFKVEGKMPDTTGQAKPFAFWLMGNRMGSDELQALVSETNADADTPPRTVADVMAQQLTGWAEVAGPDGAELPYTEQGLRDLLNIVGMAPLVLRAYIDACGAKAKN